jgi:hypothetical protein
MYNRIKPTMTVYPCRYRSQPGHPDIETEGRVWVTWERIEREHFNPGGSLVADFSKPIEVDGSQVKNHCYAPELHEEVC